MSCICKKVNKIDVLLIYDPDSSKSAASLTVGAGSFQDGEDTHGLAQLTIGLIFAGSETQTRPMEFEDHLSLHYGASNYFAEEEKTSFYFESNWEGFDRGSVLKDAKKPKFDSTLVKKQIDAMHVIVENHKEEDQWRENQSG